MIYIADRFGCSIHELYERMAPEEFEIRLVNQMVDMGYTYDQEKQRQLKHQQAIAERETFLKTCPWNQK